MNKKTIYTVVDICVGNMGWSEVDYNVHTFSSLTKAKEKLEELWEGLKAHFDQDEWVQLLDADDVDSAYKHRDGLGFSCHYDDSHRTVTIEETDLE